MKTTSHSEISAASSSANSKSAGALNRRSFLTDTAVAATGLAIVRPESVRGSQANSKVKLGVIGCGGRGVWLANLFDKHGGYQIVAGADYFQDRLEDLKKAIAVKSSRLHSGLMGYRRLIESDVDAVAIVSPPYFHPEQAAAAVDAGKHVYVAKPVAVDVPGCRSIERSGKQATAKNLVFLVDFQTRANEFFIEAIRRVHDGGIGDFCFGEATYHAGRLNKKGDDEGAAGRLRNWVFDKALSGDIITEQNIHTLDVMSWIMNSEPVAAWGTGGRKVRVDVGNCWDHFALTFQYPNNVGITFSSRQFTAYGSQPAGIRNRMFGTKGTLETQYGGQVLIRGANETFYRGGRTSAIYQEGVIDNISDFHKSITEGKVDNSTVAPSVRSNLVTILGRTAAYESRLVTWGELLKSKQTLEADLRGLKA